MVIFSKTITAADFLEDNLVEASAQERGTTESYVTPGWTFTTQRETIIGDRRYVTIEREDIPSSHGVSNSRFGNPNRAMCPISCLLTRLFSVVAPIAMASLARKECLLSMGYGRSWYCFSPYNRDDFTTDDVKYVHPLGTDTFQTFAIAFSSLTTLNAFVNCFSVGCRRQPKFRSCALNTFLDFASSACAIGSIAVLASSKEFLTGKDIVCTSTSCSDNLPDLIDCLARCDDICAGETHPHLKFINPDKLRAVIGLFAACAAINAWSLFRTCYSFICHDS